MMLLRLWAVFKIVFHTTLVVTDIISDFVYVIKVDFYNQSLKGFCILFIIVVPLLVYSVTLASIIRKIYIKRMHGENYQHFTVFAVFWVFLGPGISVLYPALEKFELFAPSELRLYFQLSTIEFFGESLPQLMIQGINNSLSDNWTSFTEFSFTISFMSLIRGCYVLATTWYRRQYEAYLNKIETEILISIKDTLRTDAEILVDNENIENLIKYKFYEKFYLNKVLFNQSHDASFKSNRELHLHIENNINEIYETKCGLNFNYHLFLRRLLNPLDMLIFLELVLVSIIWFCNLLYFVSADFHNESVRFILMFFLGLGYIISLAGSFEDIKGVTFRRFLIFRLCMVSHFDYLVKLFFNETIRTTNNLVVETLVIFVFSLPVIIIEAVNNNKVGKRSGIYLGVIVLNSFYLIIIAIRLLHLLLKNITGPTEEPNKIAPTSRSMNEEENKDQSSIKGPMNYVDTSKIYENHQ